MGYVAAIIDAADEQCPVGSSLYGTCGTEAATAAKAVTLPDFDALITGVTIHVKFTYSNTAAPATLNVNSTGAKPLCAYGTTRVGTTAATSWSAGAVVSLTYDGTSWIMNDHIPDTNTQLVNGVKGSAESSYRTGNVSITAANVGAAPTSHASTATTYGAGTNSNYGHVKLSDATDGTAAAASGGTAATPKAVSDALAAAKSYADTVAAGGLTYIGTVSAEADITGTAYKKGWYWVASAAGTYCGHSCEAGDMLIAKQDKTATPANDIDAVQANITAMTTVEIDAAWTAA